MRGRTCHELGVCHGRPSPGCTCRRDTHRLRPGGFFLAPGAIESPPARRPPRWRSVAATTLRWGWRAVSLACVLIVLLGLWGLAGCSPGATAGKPARAAKVIT